MRAYLCDLMQVVTYAGNLWLSTLHARLLSMSEPLASSIGERLHQCSQSSLFLEIHV